MSEMRFAHQIRTGREALGLSREEFARRVGTSTSTMDRIELNGHKPSVTVLTAIADLLGLSLDELLRPDRAAS